MAVIGVVLGIVTVIPGVSTGTIAVVFNVYDRLIDIISPNIKKILSAWKFWLPLGIGILVGLIFFSKIITILFANYPIPTYWFFIGIIAGSIPSIYPRMLKPDSGKPAPAVIICCILALAVMVVMTILKPAEGPAVYTVLTPKLFGILVAAGTLAATAMIIPGISGSFLLLVIGLYRTIIQAVSDLNLPLMIPVALGTIVGLLAGAALVRLLLAKAPRETYGAVLGLVAGSILVLFPGGLGSGAVIIVSIVCVLAGCAISFFSGRRES